MSTSNSPSNTTPYIHSINLNVFDEFDTQLSRSINEHKITIKEYEKQKQEFKTKQELIDKQAHTFGLYLHHADTLNGKSSFILPKFKTYNDDIITSLEEFNKVINKDTIIKYNFTEFNYLNVSRIFFDIDFKEEHNTSDLDNLFSIIGKIADELHSTKYYGLIEVVDEDMYDSVPEMFLNIDGIYTVVNPNLKQSDKKLSAHIYLNVYSYKEDIEFYMKEYVPRMYNPPKDIFDVTVYKTDIESLRCSISAKVDPKNGSVRYACQETIDLLLNNPELNYNLRISPVSTDTFIDLKPFIESVKCGSGAFSGTSSGTSYDVRNTSSNTSSQDITDISIFQYLDVKGEFDNVKDKLNNINSWEFASESLNYYRYSVLSVEEFIENVKILQVPEVNPQHNYKTWIPDVIAEVKSNYPRNITDLKPLYTLLSKVVKYRKTLKDRHKDDKQLPKEVALDIKQLKLISNKINFYIDKYQKQSFIASEKYDVLMSKKFGTEKKYKILDNVFRTIDTLTYYYPALDLKFDNITQFRSTFKLNSKTANEISDKLTTFLNYKEYKQLSIEHKYQHLSIDKKDALIKLLNEFLDWIKKSFVNEEDYKYYLGWWCEKLKILKSDERYKTLNKGIINQGTEIEGAKDSLKTYFNDLLEDYVRFKSADVVNVNKGLNGSYFINDVLVIEELPQHLKDIENLINVIKMYTSKRNLTVEEKGEKPRNIPNCNDIIINTNHTVKAMFKNKNDCEALLKRFRILIRKSLDMKNKDLNDVLDRINQDREMFSYALYNYLLSYDSTYFKENKAINNKVMELYDSVAVTDDETEKIRTTSDLETFKTNFKFWFVDSKNRIKIRTLKQYFTNNGLFLKSNTTTLKQNLAILLDGYVTVSSDKNKAVTINSETENDAYKILYEQYYVYEEPRPKDEKQEDKDEPDKTTEIEI